MKKKTALIMVTVVGIALVGASVFAKDLGMNYMENPLEETSTQNATNLADENTSLIEVSSVKQDDDNKNIIDVHFTTKVMWDDNASITSLTDSSGKSYSAKIIDKDDDDVEIYVEGIKDGTNYTAEIQGIKAYNDNSFTSLKVTFETEKQQTKASTKSNLKVKDVDFDREDKEVSFDFDKNINLKSGAYIIIKDANGNAYSSKNSRIICDEDDIELFLDKNLKQGQKYTYEIKGVKESSSNSYETIKGSFTAYDD